MGHHIDSQGFFRDDKYPDLGPDKIVLSFKDPQARTALVALAIAYNNSEFEFASDIRERLTSIVRGKGS